MVAAVISRVLQPPATRTFFFFFNFQCGRSKFSFFFFFSFFFSSYDHSDRREKGGSGLWFVIDHEVTQRSKEDRRHRKSGFSTNLEVTVLLMRACTFLRGPEPWLWLTVSPKSLPAAFSPRRISFFFFFFPFFFSVSFFHARNIPFLRAFDGTYAKRSKVKTLTRPTLSS